MKYLLSVSERVSESGNYLWEIQLLFLSSYITYIHIFFHLRDTNFYRTVEKECSLMYIDISIVNNEFADSQGKWIDSLKMHVLFIGGLYWQERELYIIFATCEVKHLGDFLLAL